MNKHGISAVIFDMDGVVSDTQKLHAKVESDLLKKYGVEIAPEEITRKYAGIKTSKFFHELLGGKSTQHNINELMEEKWRQMTDLASKSVDPIDGSVRLIKQLYRYGFKMAVASASRIDYVQRVINTLKLNNYFNFLASSDMVVNGKPNPEIFLLAASKLDTNPVNCLVIEDGMSGMIAAKLAKMKCIGLVKSRSKVDNSYPTKNLVTSLREISVRYIEGLT